jgi:hypothetical protein
MVSFFTTTLFISIGAIIFLLLVKQIELSTGHVLFSSVRPKVNRFFKTCLVLVERVLPALVREGLWGVFNGVKGTVQKLLAHALLWSETTLQKMLQTIREKTHPSHIRGEASAFLKEVGEYKKQIENDTKEERAIYDDSVKMP